MVYMASRHTLSDDQHEYLTSQDSKVPNPSEQRRRISEKVDQIFSTLGIILDSNSIDQSFKDKLFTPDKVSYFIDSLTLYNPENTIVQESNKQKIIIDMLHKVLAYLQSRYKETAFISKEIDKFRDLAKDLEARTRMEETEAEASIMYKTRKLSTPPLVYAEKDFWVALCMFCFSYSSLGKDEKDSIKKVRHAKNCSFHKEMRRLGKKEKDRIYAQFFKTFPPRDKS